MLSAKKKAFNMKKAIIACSFLTISNYMMGQNIVFWTPTNLHGTIIDNTTSVRAEALGKNTITLNGVRTAFENPATISPGDDKLQIALNYLKGSPVYPKAYYPFLGVSYRILPKLTASLTTHHYIDPDSYWNAEIGGQDFDTKKKAHHTYSLGVAAEVIEGLHVGLSGNLMQDEEIKGMITSKDFIMNLGVIYDRKVKFFKSNPNISHENFRVAASMFNLLMDGQTIQRQSEAVWQYRDMPIIARAGVAYEFSLPLKLSFAQKSKKLKSAPQTIDLSARLQYGNWLKSKKHIYDEYKYHTHVGIGLEAVALKLLALRLGYFTESRTVAENPVPGTRYATKDKRKGLTWGLGAIIPARDWSNGKLPFEIRFDLLLKNHPDLLDESISQRSAPEFTDKKIQFGIGIELAIK